MKLRLFINRSIFSIYFGLLLLTLPFLTLFTIFANYDKNKAAESKLAHESVLGSQMIELKEKLVYSEMLNQKLMLKVNYLKELVEVTFNQSLNNFNKNNLSAKDEIISDNFITLPTLLTFLPHLSKSVKPLRPAFRLISSKLKPTGKIGANIVIGVPTVKRPRQSYLIQSLHSFIQSMNEEEKQETVIVVLIAEVSFYLTII